MKREYTQLNIMQQKCSSRTGLDVHMVKLENNTHP